MTTTKTMTEHPDGLRTPAAGGHDMLVECCTDCEAANINRREGRNYSDAERWRCGDCGATFPEPGHRYDKRVMQVTRDLDPLGINDD